MKELGGFILDRTLGQGVTAQVYAAYREREGKREWVALKVFHPAMWSQVDLRKRAMNEYRTVSALKHPNIVQVLEALWDTSPPAVAMEFIDGSSLEEFQNRLPYILPEVGAAIVIEVLAALEYAHGQGVIHRDLKPSNILIGRDGRAVVGDFGLAKVVDFSQLTMSGTILGSPDFMSPEQARGDVLTPQSDLFSMAAILYFLVTGTRPFARHTPLSTLSAVNECKFEAPQRRNPKISPALARLIHKGLSKEPSARFGSAGEFRQALQEYLDSIGLAREGFSFAHWMRSPTETTMSALKIIAERLVERCEALKRSSDLNAFHEALAHLSLVSPENGAIPRLMSEMAQGERMRKSRKRFWLGLSFATAAAGIGAAIVFWPASKRAEPAVAAAPVLCESPAVVAAPVPSPSVVADTLAVSMAAAVPPAVAPEPVLRKSARKPAAPAKRIAAAPSPVPPTGEVRFALPVDVQVFWDDKRIDSSQPLLKETIGKHELRLEKPGAKPIRASVWVKEDEPTVIQVN